MLSVHCNTVQRKGKGKMKIHTHCHVNIQADGICFWGPLKLVEKRGKSLGHRTSIPVLGSKQWLNLQGWHEGLAGEGGPSLARGAHGCWLLKWGGHWQARCVRRPSGSCCDGCPMVSAVSWPLPFLRTNSPGQGSFTWHAGTPPLDRHGHPIGDGVVTPSTCCFPQSGPPSWSSQSPFTAYSLK
jgi:hypothetical protein